jgi:DNA-binding NarL/FixJ family response regulator
VSLRVLLVDDHALVRSGLKLVLRQIDPSIEVSEASNGRDAVTLARQTAPDLCLLDISMPGLNGIDAIPQLLQASPRTRVLVLSMHGDKQYVTEALKAGAQGYLLKDSAVDELAGAVRALCEGRSFLGREAAAVVLADFIRLAPQDEAAMHRTADHRVLTARQREVLQRIAEGRSTREIADDLHLSVKTVESHRAEIMRRLDIHDVAGLTRYALRQGMISLGP